MSRTFTLLFLGLTQGCSVGCYEFKHPASPKTVDETMVDARACHATATQGLDFSTWSQEQQDAAAVAWSQCMRSQGYLAVKR